MRKTREVKGRIAVTDKICVETRRGDERDRAGEQSRLCGREGPPHPSPVTLQTAM